MENKILLSAMMVGLFLSQGAQAALAPEPAKCPDVSAIVAAGVNSVLEANRGQWEVYQRSNYNTQDQWVFAMGYFATEEEALPKAAKALQTLDFLAGPKEIDSRWLCMYSSDHNVFAAAFTPAEGWPDQLHRLRA